MCHDNTLSKFEKYIIRLFGGLDRDHAQQICQIFIESKLRSTGMCVCANKLQLYSEHDFVTGGSN